MQVFKALVVVAVLLTVAAQSQAVTLWIGDVDSFGLTNIINLNGPNATPNVDADPDEEADVNQEGKLTTGDFLPDLDNDGSVNVSGADEFDNRSAAAAWLAGLPMLVAMARRR